MTFLDITILIGVFLAIAVVWTLLNLSLSPGTPPPAAQPSARRKLTSYELTIRQALRDKPK